MGYRTEEWTTTEKLKRLQCTQRKKVSFQSAIYQKFSYQIYTAILGIDVI